jgi:TPR repeat protein
MAKDGMGNFKAVDEDLQKRMLQFEIDCDDGKGNGYACHSVAEFKAVIEGKYEEAAVILGKNCDGRNNYGASCFKLGRYLIKGQGVPQNDKLAFNRFEKACNGGISAGCHFLGI